MTRRAKQSMIALLLSMAAMFFIVFPQWQIEHPNDASLILRDERHFLWQAPVHAHVDLATIAIPVLAIVIVAIALFTVSSHNN